MHLLEYLCPFAQVYMRIQTNKFVLEYMSMAKKALRMVDKKQGID